VLVGKPLFQFASACLIAATALFVSPQPGSAQHNRTEDVGDVLMVAAPVVALASTLVLKEHDGAQQFVLGFVANAGVTKGLKYLVDKDRPDGSDQNSLPSGHTSIAFQSATFFHFRYGLRSAVPAYAAAAFVGYSRMHADKHFFEDVLLGAAIGALSARLFTGSRAGDGSSGGAVPNFAATVNAAGRVTVGYSSR
jgi:hypothetical protein